MLTEKICVIKDQVIEDPNNNMTIQFEVVADGTTRLRIFCDALEFGNRDFAFDLSGELVGSGLAINPTRPTFMVDVSKL